MKHFMPALAALAFLCATAVPEALAWGKTWKGFELERAVASAPWKFGPFKIDPALNLNNVGYDTNLYYGYAGEPIKDFTLTAGPGFTVYLPLKRKVVFEIYESPQYVYFRKTKKERTWNNFFSGRIHFAFNRFYVSLGGGLTDAKQRWTTEIDIRPRRKEKSWQGAVLWQATKKTSFLAQGSRTEYDYENLDYATFNLRDRLNRREDRLSFSGYYQLTFRVRLFLSAEYGRYDFLQNVSNFKDSQSYGFFGGFEFSPFGIMRGRINIGYKILDPLDKAQKGYKGLAGDSQFSLRPLKILALRISYKRDIPFSVWYRSTYYLETRLSSGVSFYVLKRIRLDYDYFDGKNRYLETALTGADASVKRRDDYSTHSVGLFFRLKKNIGIGVVASRWKRQSNLIEENDNRDFVGINLTYDF